MEGVAVETMVPMDLVGGAPDMNLGGVQDMNLGGVPDPTLGGAPDTTLSSSMGRRGLKFRQPRTINVRKTLGETDNTDQTSGYSTSDGSQTTSSSTTSRFQPKLYVPERLRKAAEQAPPSQHGASAGISGYGSGAVSSMYGHDLYSSSPQEVLPGASDGLGGLPVPSSSSYSARVLRGRAAEPAPETLSSTLSTTRGTFQLRPRRNIRGKSTDELENNSGASAASRSRPSVDVPRTYTTGFTREPPASKDNLARRGRQTVTDMLGSVPHVGSHTPYSALDGGAVPPLHEPVAMDTATTDHEPQLAFHPELERHISQSLKQNLSSNLPSHLQSYQPSIPLYSIPAGIDLSSEIRCPPVGSEMNDHVEVPMTVPNDTSQMFMDDKTGLEYNNNSIDKSDIVVNGDAYSHIPSGKLDSNDYVKQRFETAPTSHPIVAPTPMSGSYSDRVAAILGRSIAAPVAKEQPPQNETIDEKKERILRELMHRKMEAANAKSRPSDPNFETLEQKKERMFANLRQKHDTNTQASDLLYQSVNSSRYQGHDILGLSGIKPQYSRSRSLGDTLESGDNIGMDSQNIENSEDIFSQSEVAPNVSSIGRYTHSMGNQSLSREPTPGQSEQSNTVPEVIERDPGIHHILYSGSSRYEDRHSHGASPIEDMGSVDSGFHGGDAGTASGDSPTVDARIKLESQPTPESQRPEVIGSKVQSSQVKPVKKEEPAKVKVTPAVPAVAPKTKQVDKSEPKVPAKVVNDVRKPLKALEESKKAFLQREDEDSSEETLVKPSDVKAASGSYLRKTGPPTRPKPGNKTNESVKPPVKVPTTSRTKPPMPQPVKPPVPPPQKQHQSRSQTPSKSQPPRPKSAPPSKSKSIANLTEMPSSPRTERRASVATRDDTDASPFSRNGRLRSSTRAWEMKQAEKQAEVRTRTTSRSSTPVKSTTPKKSVITGQVSLSAEQAANAAVKEKPTHTPRMSSNYEKPWRRGSALETSNTGNVGSFLIRSAQPDKNVLPDRPKKPISNPSSGSTSRAESPDNKTRTPVKGLGSAVHQGCLRSQPNLAKSSPGVKNKPSLSASKLSKISRSRIQLDGSSQSLVASSVTSPNHVSNTKRTTTPKPFKFNYIPRSRRSSVSSDAGSDFGSDIEDFLQKEEESMLSDAQDLGQSDKQEAGKTDENLSGLTADESFNLTEETMYLEKLAQQWKMTTIDDLTRGVSPDSGLSVRTTDSDRPFSPRSSGDGSKSFFTNWIDKPPVYGADSEPQKDVGTIETDHNSTGNNKNSVDAQSEACKYQVILKEQSLGEEVNSLHS